MKNKIIQVFLDSDMRNQFEGLTTLCANNKIKVPEKETGEFVVFINKRRNYLKILACNGTAHPVLAAYKTPERIIDIRILSQIPRAFNATGKFDVDKATEVFLKGKLGA